MAGRIINAVIWHSSRIFVQFMSGQRDVLDQLVSIPAKCFARGISVVHPDFVGLREIDGLAGISSKTCDRMDHLAGAQVHNFNGPLVLSWNEQALAFDVHRHVVEIALNIRQWDALDLFQWRAGLAPRCRNQDHTQSQENCCVPFHSFAPRLNFPCICFARAEALLPRISRPFTFAEAQGEARGYPSRSREPTACRSGSPKLRRPAPAR